MNRWESLTKALTVVFALVFLGGCASEYYNPYYSVQPPPPQQVAAPPENQANPLTVGEHDRLYVMHVENLTRFPIRLPRVHHVLYEKGYDQVGRQKEADFSLDISLITEARDNPNLRGEHALAGAVLGAATGALLGAAGGRPVLGTIVGASSGGFFGLAAPADTPMVRIDIRTLSYRDGSTSSKSVVVDMAHVPPYDVPRIVDIQVSRMLQDLPAR